MRAPGEAPGLMALEIAIDELAEKAGIDPVEFRMKLHTGGVNAGGGGIRAPLSTRTRRNRETGIAEVNRNLLQRYAKHFRCRLGQRFHGNGAAVCRRQDYQRYPKRHAT